MASLPDDIAPAELTVEEAIRLLEQAKKEAQLLGQDPTTGEPIYLAHGRYGPYIQLGETPERGSKEPTPQRASIPRDLDESEITLELALKWLSLPRSLGEDPENGEEVVATTGRYGPFIKRGKDTRSLQPEDDVYTIGLERALELMAQPKARRGRARAARKVLREMGTNEQGAKIQLLDGPYGPYLTDGDLNASLPKGTDPESVTPELAARILSERGKPPKRMRRKRKAKK